MKFNVTKNVLFISALFVTSSCMLNHHNWVPHYKNIEAAKKSKIEGYGPIKFGMKREDVVKLLESYGQGTITEEQAKAELSGTGIPFREIVKNQLFDGQVIFDKKTDTVSKIEFNSVDAKQNVQTPTECFSYFKEFVTALTGKYGDLDFPLKEHPEGATAFITFGDSSGVRANYNAVDNACKIKVVYNGPWAS